MILDSDIAGLFGVSTKRLNEQIRRNGGRFPDDFAFRLTASEEKSLRSHFATSNSGRGGRRYLPFVLTEHGVVMAANVLNSSRAVAMSVNVVRAFVRLRKISISQSTLARKVKELENAVKARLDDHDVRLEELFATVESLVGMPDYAKRNKRIGFIPSISE